MFPLTSLVDYILSPQDVPANERPDAMLMLAISGVAVVASIALFAFILHKFFPKTEGSLNERRNFGVDGVGGVVAILIWFGCMVVAVFLAPYAHYLIFDREMVLKSQEQTLLLQSITLLCAPLFIVVAGKMNPRAKNSLYPQGHLLHLWKCIPALLGWYALAISIGIFGLALTDVLGGDSAAKQDVLKTALEETDVKYLHGIVAVMIAAPIIEEAIFRGGVFGAMRRGMNFWFAALGSSIIFLISHDPMKVPALAPGIFLLGFVLAYTYERTGNIWYGVTIHALHNGTTLCVHWFGGAGS